MIDVQPYLDKLERAKEWMALVIDRKDYNNRQYENFGAIFRETYILTDIKSLSIPSFEEYLNHSKQLTP